MSTHKDLPGGSQAWAGDVDKLMAEVKRLTEVVKRLSQNAGLDFSNPQRGVNVGDTPSIRNPVGQKLSSLADTDTYNVLDKQVLSWNQQGQKWLPVTLATGGVQWEPATEDETLLQMLDSDSDYFSTQVIGIHSPTEYDDRDSYGLVGTSNTSAFLHGSRRGFGGDTMTGHGYVTAQPYYVNMGVLFKDDDPELPWDTQSSMGLDRQTVYFRTAQYQTSPYDADGNIIMFTNWFYCPQFTTANRPVPPSFPANHKGTMIYDMDLGIPLWYNGSAWADALGTVV